jgi:3-deoxy-7-phosphoheptulonate synthase
LIRPTSKAAIAVGADGLIIEVHIDPDSALSDGPQSVTPADFASIMGDLRKYVELEGRHIG